MAQSVRITNIQDSKVPEVSISHIPTNSLTMTGINSIWEPSSDDANPSSVTIIKIDATMPPVIDIMPTSSTSQKKKTISSSFMGSVNQKSSSNSASSKGAEAKSKPDSPTKTIEKKITTSQIEPTDNPDIKENIVVDEVNKNTEHETKETTLHKSSQIRQESDTNRIKKFDAQESSQLLEAFKTGDDGTSITSEFVQDTSSQDQQIPSLSPSSQLNSLTGSSLEPTPLDMPTSWTSTNKETETTPAMMPSNIDVFSKVCFTIILKITKINI